MCYGMTSLHHSSIQPRTKTTFRFGSVLFGSVLFGSVRPWLLGCPLRSRFGHILSPADLESLLPSQDPAVALHVARLRTLMLSQQQRQQQDQPVSLSADEDVDMPSAQTAAPAAGHEAGAVGGGREGGDGGDGGGGSGGGARVRNRRYRRLKQLADGGVWFSDEAMKERDPWLWFEYVGRRAGEEKPAPKQAIEQVGFRLGCGVEVRGEGRLGVWRSVRPALPLDSTFCVVDL